MVEKEVDVISEIETTLNWAFGLKAKAVPQIIKLRYRDFVKTSKDWIRPIPEDLAIDIAYSTLKKREIAKLPGFKEAWKLQLTLLGKNVS